MTRLCVIIIIILLAFTATVFVFLLTGYVQGMSDLLSPILYVLDNEVDAFWCFVGFMNRVVSDLSTDEPKHSDIMHIIYLAGLIHFVIVVKFSCLES